MSSFNRLKELEEARQKQKEARERLLKRMRTLRSKPVRQAAPSPNTKLEPEPKRVSEPPPPLEVVQQYGLAGVPVYRDDEDVASVPSNALQQLVNLYLHAAQHGTRHIALVWPACPRTLVLIHTLATLERWARGDKQGVRGLVYPVKSNAFYPLNHLHLGRTEILEHAQRLCESQGAPNDKVTRSLYDKDAYLFSLASLKSEERELFNPTIGELLPHFLAGADFKEWQSCSNRLLVCIKAKLVRRIQAKALQQISCSVIGDPKTAPDAIFCSRWEA